MKNLIICDGKRKLPEIARSDLSDKELEFWIGRLTNLGLLSELTILLAEQRRRHGEHADAGPLFRHGEE